MFDKINELESKGFRICIYPQYFHGEWKWIAGVYIGNNNVGIWMPDIKGSPRNTYDHYEDAFNDLVNYCENYKPPKIHITTTHKR